MLKEKILVIGASGQIGVELTLALRKIYVNANVTDHLCPQGIKKTSIRRLTIQ